MIVADLVLLGIAYGGVEAFLPKGVDVTFWVQLLGGLLLLILGGATILKKPKNTEGSPLTHERRIIKHLSMGFLLNIINPANFLEWVGTASVLKTKYHFETFENVSFFAGALLAVFGTELSVAYFASRLRRVLSPRLMYRINIVSGLVFRFGRVAFVGSSKMILNLTQVQNLRQVGYLKLIKHRNFTTKSINLKH